MLKKARETFNEMITLCYDEDFPELHKEISSLRIEIKKSKDYELGMQEILSIIPLFADDFPENVFYKLENIYEEFLES